VPRLLLKNFGITEPNLPAFRRALLAWYEQNRRDLPWRRTRDPYRIWISEIMLQQTRVNAVTARYDEFLRRFPRIEKLASARQTSVLAAWSGLGYYRRARNLHAAAKVIMRERQGVFPCTSAALRTLPGIGRYTAVAIASIAFGEPAAVVDGNVERVICRISGGSSTSAATIWTSADQLLCRDHPGDFNQAMMELGATICLPGRPACSACPVQRFCRTQGRHHSVPKPKQIKREIAYALAQGSDSVLLVKRGDGERLMPGMWELPRVTSPNGHERLFSVRHSITTSDYTVHVLAGREVANGTWIKNSRLGKLPLTGLTKKILRRAEII
jgi:A/G-specific adenine glycosylase